MIGSCLYSDAIASYVLAAETVILSTHSIVSKEVKKFWYNIGVVIKVKSFVE